MSLRSGARVVVLVSSRVGAAVALDAGASTMPARGRRGSVSEARRSSTRPPVRSGARVGPIVLRPRLYRQLVIGWRSGKPLRIVGTRGTRIESVIFDRAYRGSLGHVTIGPIRGDALDVRAHDTVLHDLVVTARGTRFSLGRAHPGLAQRHDPGEAPSRTAATGRGGSRGACLWRWSRSVVIEDNWFHDCRGCDFVHGRFGSDLTIRRNRFERALPCRGMSAHRRGHQDLVQLFAGQRLRVERNRFGIQSRRGAAVPDERGRSRDDREQHLRRHRPATARLSRVWASSSVRVEALAALRQDREQHDPHRRPPARRLRRLDPDELKYGSVLPRKRPIVANNVIGP